MTPKLRHVDAQQAKEALPFSALIPALFEAARTAINAPQRTVTNIKNDSKLLIMPAHSYRSRMGVKLISVFGENKKIGCETIQGVYCLFDSENGSPLLTIDAAEITARRTAATSALMANILATANANKIAIAGAGKLLPYFMEAYVAIRPQCVFRLWARNFDRLSDQKKELERIVQRPIQVFKKFEGAVSEADIISTITSAREPILFGEWLEPGMHIDLVGAHTLQMAEADPKCFQRAKIFVDSKEAVLHEAGDLVTAMLQTTIDENDIIADLFDFAAGRTDFVRDQNDITLFKSVGHAFEDLVAAVLVEDHLKSS